MDLQTLIASLPSAALVRDRLGDVLREERLLRMLLRLAERAEDYAEADAESKHRGGVVHAD